MTRAVAVLRGDSAVSGSKHYHALQPGHDNLIFRAALLIVVGHRYHYVRTVL